MVNARGKRKIEVDGKTYFWFIRKNDKGIPRIRIVSDDKKTNIELPMLDTEVPVTPAYIAQKLRHLGE